MQTGRGAQHDHSKNAHTHARTAPHGWPVLGGAVWTAPGAVHSAPEEDPRKVFIGGKWAVGAPGMECLLEGIQTHTPAKPRGPGPT